MTLLPDGMSPPAARAFFPRGLFQPRNGCRFSSDALLLGCFLQPAEHMRILDLGAGCGAVGLTMLCRCPSLTVVAADIQPGHVSAAGKNAARLGFGHAFTPLHADVAAPDFPPGQGSFDIVLANPPYRRRDRGRLPSDPSRLLSLFEKPGTVRAFCEAAARALRIGGRFGIIFPANRRGELSALLVAAHLTPVRLTRVHPRNGAPPRVVLMEAIRTAASAASCATVDETSLILHPDRRDAATGFRGSPFSAAALEFCPFLSPRRA